MKISLKTHLGDIADHFAKSCGEVSQRDTKASNKAALGIHVGILLFLLLGDED